MPPVVASHVGYYVDAAPGAIARARSVVRHLRSRVTMLSSGPIPEFDGYDHHRLPSIGRRPPPVIDPTAYSIGGPDAVAGLAAWVQQQSPSLLVVDGAPDVALLGRLAGVPVVPVRRFGRCPRRDEGALEHVAAAWLAAYPAALEPGETSELVRSRTLHAGLMSPFEDRTLSKPAARRLLGLHPDVRHVTIVTGADGLGIGRDEVLAAAATVPTWSLSILGRCGGETTRPVPERVRIEGWLDDPLPHLVAADVVVAGASLSIVSDVAAVRRPLALLPRPSPGDEEVRLARALADLRAATVLDAWPRPERWPDLLTALGAVDPRALRKLCDGRGARRAAEWIDAWATSAPLDAAAELAVSFHHEHPPSAGVEADPDRARDHPATAGVRAVGPGAGNDASGHLDAASER